MRHITTTHNLQLNNFLNIDNFYEDSIFFDIETTGLSKSSCYIYMIGAGTYSDNSYTIQQWFTESSDDEILILKDFLSFLKPFKRIINFNGKSFDIPFVKQRCKFHNINCELDNLICMDIYKDISPYKNVLKLINLKQKTIEDFLGISRDDEYDGGKLIKIYHNYVKTKDTKLLDLLLLHNHDDMLGLAKILQIELYVMLFNGKIDFEINSHEIINDSEIMFNISLPFSFNGRVSNGNKYFYMIIENNCLKITVKIHNNELKLFHNNYKDYFYLPEEDCAIHKSLAIYTDKSHRIKASADNCYTKIKYDSSFISNKSSQITYIKSLLVNNDLWNMM